MCKVIQEELERASYSKNALYKPLICRKYQNTTPPKFKMEERTSLCENKSSLKNDFIPEGRFTSAIIRLSHIYFISEAQTTINC